MRVRGSRAISPRRVRCASGLAKMHAFRSLDTRRARWLAVRVFPLVFHVTDSAHSAHLTRRLRAELRAASEREHGVGPMTLPITIDEILWVPGMVQAATLVKWRCSSLA